MTIGGSLFRCDAVFVVTRLVAVILLSAFISSCSQEQVVEFEVETADGRFFSAAHKDKVVYLDFWATWCAPCRASFPWMNEMRDKYQDQGLQIVAVSIDADQALVVRVARCWMYTAVLMSRKKQTMKRRS